MEQAAAEHHRRQHPVLRWVSFGEQVVGGVALVTIFVLVLLQAAQRYLPLSGWAWTGELARYCLVWLTFSMVGHLLGRDEHITLQIVDNVRSPLVLRLVKAFANLVVAAVSIAFVLEGYELVSDDTGQVTPALQMPLVWLYVIPLVGFALTAVRALLGIVVPDVTDAPSTPNEAI